MRLTSITASGLRNLINTSVDLTSRLVAFVGPNGTGKTALSQQAPKLLVLGHDPAVGKRLQDTRTQSPVGEIEVAGTFNTGFSIHRRFARSTETTVAPPRGESNDGEAQARIVAETGCFMPALDLNDLLDQSDEKRQGALFSLLSGTGAAVEQDEMREWVGYEGLSPASQRAVDKVWTEKVRDAQDRLDGIGSAIDFVHEHVKEADKERKRRATVADDLEAKAVAGGAPEDVPTEDLPTLQDELQGVMARLEEIRAEERERVAAAARRRKHLEAAEAAEIRAAGARSEIERLEAELAGMEAIPGREALEAEIRAAEAALAAAPAPDAAALESARNIVRHQEKVVEGRHEEVHYASQERTKREAEAKAARRLAGSLAGVETCPTCGGSTDLAAAREAADDDAKARDVALEEALTAEHDAEERLRTARVALADAREVLQGLTTQAERRAEAQARAQNAEAAVDRARAEGERQRSRAESALSAARATLEGAKAERLRLGEAPPAPAEYADEASPLEEKAARIRARIQAVQDAAEAIGAARERRRAADQARADLDAQTLKHTELKGILAGLRKYRSELVRRLVEPVQDTANTLLQRIDPAKKFAFQFEREGRPVFDFGFEEDGKFVGYVAASGGESVFLLVAFVAGLLDAVQPAWRPLWIEDAEHVDERRLRWLMVALAEIGDSVFDNVFLACCRGVAEVEGWQVVDMEALTGGAAQRQAA